MKKYLVQLHYSKVLPKNPNRIGLIPDPSLVKLTSDPFLAMTFVLGMEEFILRALSLCHDVSFWIENVDVGVLLS